MNDLKVIKQNGPIKVYETNKGEKVVDARELHDGLESKQDFSTWVKARLNEFDAIENDDYICFHKKKEANNATMIEYILKLDTAKQMAMLERNEQGKKYRKYFIEIEDKYKQIQLDTSKLSPQMQLLNQMVTYMAKQEIEVKAIQDTANKALEFASNLKDVFVHECDNWRDELNHLFNKIQKSSNIPFSELRKNTYESLENRARCDLSTRVRKLKERLSNEGATKTSIGKVTRIDVIEADIRIKEIYTQIIKEYAIKYVV